MTNVYSVVENILRELRYADALSVRGLVAELHHALANKTIDAQLHERVLRECRTRNVDFDVRWTPAALNIGEAYLLTFSSSANRGLALRLRLLPDICGFSPGICESSQSAIRLAWDGVMSTLAQNGCGAPEPFGTGHRLEVHGPIGNYDRVEGGSLGLSFAIALLSRWLGSAPSSTTAGSAQVTQAGELAPVSHLQEKLQALRAQWPNVRQIVVSSQQALPALEGELSDLEVVRCHHLKDALPYFALQLTRELLPLTDQVQLHRRLDNFRYDNDAAHSGPEWMSLSNDAAYVGSALEPDDPRMAEAWSWASLFALHAGDLAGAEYYARRIKPEHRSALSASARAWCEIRDASVKIDSDPHAALSLAELALETTLSLAPADRRDLEGRARGTLGRAMMHAGRLSDALHELVRAAEHHRSVQRAQLSRSLCYVATCKRLSGDVVGAIESVDEALRHLDLAEMRRNEGTPFTRRFLMLERGRCQLELEDSRGAVISFENVLATEPDESYPLLAALRGLARAHRLVRDHDRSDRYLRRCLSVADRAEVDVLLRKVAAAAAGDALLDTARGYFCGVGQAVLREAWRLVDPDLRVDVEAPLRSIIY